MVRRRRLARRRGVKAEGRVVDPDDEAPVTSAGGRAGGEGGLRVWESSVGVRQRTRVGRGGEGGEWASGVCVSFCLFVCLVLLLIILVRF